MLPEGFHLQHAAPANSRQRFLTTRRRRVRSSAMNQPTELRRELGLADLVLMQVVFVVGSGWVGTAAKLGPSHLVFWLLAIALYYLPQAAVVIHLNRRMP